MQKTTAVKRLFLLVLALVFTMTQLSAAPINLENPNMTQTIKVIAGERFAGRLAGTEGNRLCGDYLAERFEAIGLEKFDTNSYYQTFTNLIYPADKQVHELTVTFENGQTKSYTYGKDYVDRIKAVDLEINLPITLDTNRASIYNIAVVESTETLQKVDNKAAAVLIKSDNFFGSLMVRNDMTPTFQVTPALFNELKNNRVKSVAIRSKYEASTVEISNIIGKIKGGGKNALILSAHYDHAGTAGEADFLGTIDNASGVTVLLDLAQKLKAYSEQNPFQNDIYICAFNGEENGANGSRTFLTSIQNQYENIYNINLDCLGIKDGPPLGIVGDDIINRELKAELAKYADKYGIPYIIEPGFGSDHLTFQAQGYIAAGLGQIDWNILHTEEETIDRIDYRYLEKISRMVYDFVLGNDGRIFPRSNLRLPSQEVYYKLYQIAALERFRLAYDEVETVEIDGYRCSISGTQKALGAEDIQKYYPDMQYPESFMGLPFTQAMIFNDYFYRIEGMALDNPQGSGTAQKREISADNIRWGYFIYEKDGAMAVIMFNLLESGARNPVLNVPSQFVEQVDIDGKLYYLYKGTASGTYGKATQVIEGKNGNYFIEYFTMGNSGLSFQPKEYYESLLREWDMDTLVKDLNI